LNRCVGDGSDHDCAQIIGGIALLAIIIVGVAAGVSLSKKGSSNSGISSSKGNSTSKDHGNGPVKQTDPNDPSTFIKDPKLKQSLWAMAYTPEGSQLPGCGNNLSEYMRMNAVELLFWMINDRAASVIEDIQLMSQLTTRLRLYGADCNQSALVVSSSCCIRLVICSR
jgi:hypothetical protein